MNWRVQRGAAFYGKGTGQDEIWRDLARRGKLHLPVDGSDYITLVHISDMAIAAARAIEVAPPEAIYVVYRSSAIPSLVLSPVFLRIRIL